MGMGDPRPAYTLNIEAIFKPQALHEPGSGGYGVTHRGDQCSIDSLLAQIVVAIPSWIHRHLCVPCLGRGHPRLSGMCVEWSKWMADDNRNFQICVALGHR